MIMPRRMVVGLLLAFLFCISGWAQDKPDLSGTWKLNVDKSDYGDLQGPSSRTDVIQQRGNEIIESVTAEQKHKPLKYVMHFSTDGQKTVFPAGQGIHIPPAMVQGISASWQGSSLVVIEDLRFEDSSLPARYVYALSPTGNELTMTLFLGRSIAAAVFVFDKASSQNSALGQ